MAWPVVVVGNLSRPWTFQPGPWRKSPSHAHHHWQPTDHVFSAVLKKRGSIVTWFIIAADENQRVQDPVHMWGGELLVGCLKQKDWHYSTSPAVAACHHTKHHYVATTNLSTASSKQCIMNLLRHNWSMQYTSQLHWFQTMYLSVKIEHFNGLCGVAGVNILLGQVGRNVNTLD